MTPRDAAALDRLSPNQIDKRRRIVAAARRVLAQDGLAGCTARAVADASPLTKSAIHYYFSDMDDLIDLAMGEHITAFVAAVRGGAERHDAPVERFWAAAEGYFRIFREMPSSAELWFEYWADATRKGRLEPVDLMHGQVMEIFAEKLAAIPVDDPSGRARVLFSYLLGSVVQQAVRPRPAAEIRAEIAGICGLDAA